MRKIVISAAGFMVFIIIGFGIFKALTAGPEPEAEMKNEIPVNYVQAEEAQYNDYGTNITAFGRLKALKRIEVFSEVNGIMLPESDRFKTGYRFAENDVMIKIDDRESKLSLQSSKSEFLRLLTSILPDMKADFPESFQKWNSYLENFDINEPIEELPDYNPGKEKYFLAARGIFTQFYNIKNLELRHSKFTIRAPFDGVVAMSLTEPGQLVRMGAKLGEFAGTGAYELELSVHKDDIPFIGTGNNVKITTEESNTGFDGKIRRISKIIDPQTQTVKVYAYVYGSGLKEGMYMKGIIDGTEIKDVVRVPRKALHNNKELYRIRDGKLDKISVKVVKISGDYAFVREIEPGITIVTEPLVNAEIGQEVKPISSKN